MLILILRNIAYWLIVTLSVPVFGTLWGALFLGEPVTASMLAGGAVVLLGTGLATGVIGGQRSP